MLEKLLNDHHRLRTCADALRLYLNKSELDDMEGLAKARWSLGSQVMQHLAFEDRHLYTKFDHHPDPNIVKLGATFQAELQTLFADYVAHAKSWTPDAIQREWDKYRSTTLSFLTDLIARIDREENEIFPIFAKNGMDTKLSVSTSRNWAKNAFEIKDVLLKNGSAKK